MKWMLKKNYMGFLINKKYVVDFEVFHWNISLNAKLLFRKCAKMDTTVNVDTETLIFQHLLPF